MTTTLEFLLKDGKLVAYYPIENAGFFVGNEHDEKKEIEGDTTKTYVIVDGEIQEFVAEPTVE